MNETRGTSNGKQSWQQTQDALAERAGLSVLLVEGHQPPALAVSNNNSICRVVQSSQTHAERCEPFCGAAYQKTLEAGKPINYRCHAGLYCVAAPVENEEKPLVAIVGRAFLKTSDYRDLTERIFLGDWQNLPEIELFENINLSASLKDLEKLAERLQNLNPEERRALSALTKAERELSDEETLVLPEPASDVIAETDDDVLELDAPEQDSAEILVLDDDETIFAAENEPEPPAAKSDEKFQNSVSGSTEEIMSEWRVKSASALKQNYQAAVAATADFIADYFDFESLAWLEQRGQHFKALLQKGTKFGGDIGKINLNPNDELLRQAARNRTSLLLENKNTGEEIELFPVVSGIGEIHAAVVVADGTLGDDARRRLSDFLAEISLPLEVLRLREEIEQRARLQAAIKKFNSDLQNAEPENLLDAVAESCSELVGAERVSLLLFDENAKALRTAAAIGKRAEEIKNETTSLGARIVFRAFQENKPILVSDVAQLNLPPVEERVYQSRSFLILPLSIGGRIIGVLNVTDKRIGGILDELDLQLLEAIAPQIAFALDRASTKQRAGEYKAASITDALTGLRNRRYLEGRLDEEIRRSQRHGYPVSFMMIDVDFFKKYNDTFGHQAGDEALRIVANCLRSTLRGADVAVRYGGEEFSILLPQTTQSEARVIAERIRRRIEATNFPHDKVTISGGIVAFTPQGHETPEWVIKAADQALYAAKRAGRNNIQFYGNGNGGSV
ncbi:MAG: diguanylate cyclase [Acidobacteriota bacterium]|nr:diguanylate cyclase [Acidobacteriota bacterium]